MDATSIEYSHWANEVPTSGNKVCFCIPTITRPYPEMLASLEAEVPHLEKAGFEHSAVYCIGNPYISNARATMLRKALDAKADMVVFIDHDISWREGELCHLLLTPGEVVAGTYRYKRDDEEDYMGALLSGPDGCPRRREEDGCLYGHSAPAGFLKVTTNAVNKFIEAYPELCYGARHSPHIDLFNHGAHGNIWYGEDYAFSRRWRECGGELIINQYLNLTHHSPDKRYPGNFDLWLRRQEGGDLELSL